MGFFYLVPLSLKRSFRTGLLVTLPVVIPIDIIPKMPQQKLLLH